MNRPGPRDSVYVLPNGMAPGTIFGVFTEQRILGYIATIIVKELQPEECMDALGVPMRQGDLCIHVSGKDLFGKETPGQYLRAFGSVREVWSDRDKTENMVIARNPPHLLRLGQELPSHAEWSPSESFITLCGITERLSGRVFNAEDVIAEVNLRRPGGLMQSLRAMHVKVARRLLNNVAGVRRHGIERIGRWSFAVVKSSSGMS